MESLALLITMDIEGKLYLEATVPDSYVTQRGNGTSEIRIPVPRSVGPKIGQALIEASATTFGVEAQESQLN